VLIWNSRRKIAERVPWEGFAMTNVRFALIVLFSASVALTATTRAEVTKVEIALRADVLGGKPFGSAGSYEKLVGKVYYSVDPTHPRNAPIADLDKAPRDASGRVTFSADLYVLAPKDAARGNNVALFDVVNRGRKNVIQYFNRAPQSADPTSEAISGTAFSCGRVTPSCGSAGSSIYRTAAGSWP
jgi:hypothetical protein